MSGALLQLVAIGAQDAMLIGDQNKVTFFSLVTRCHTNFAMESIDQTVNGTSGFGRTISSTISRNGDLVSRVYVEATLPALSNLTDGTSWIPDIGNFMIKEADIEIGGQRIDRHYGEWLHIWNELSGKKSHQDGYNRMIGNTPSLTAACTVPSDIGDAVAYVKRTTLPEQKLLIPLQFWFCRSPGLALPLIALQYHEVKINVTFRERNELLRTLVDNYKRDAAGDTVDASGTKTTDKEKIFVIGQKWSIGNYTGPATGEDLEVKLWVDYIYLDNDERRRFATQPHNYLIDQLQTNGSEAIRGAHDRYELDFNHPVKELIWFVKSDSNPLGVYSYPAYTDVQMIAHGYKFSRNSYNQGGISEHDLNEVRYVGNNPVSECKIILNGHDRFKERAGLYFDSVQSYQHHSNTPERAGINVYSFGLSPEQQQPSGSCNFSRIDNATLEVSFRQDRNKSYDYKDNNEKEYYDNASIVIYAVNYNQLKIISGMGGLAFSN